ncbi:pyridoxine 5'-phosphate oxidase C-terminal domain-containing protein [Pseudomonas sp. PCH446]
MPAARKVASWSRTLGIRVLYWRETSQQIVLNGRAERLSEARADAAWRGRPHVTHPMSAVSRQSEELTDVEALRARAKALSGTQAPLPRPDGYCLFELRLESVEFWGNGQDRLHERLRYDRTPTAGRCGVYSPR